MEVDYVASVQSQSGIDIIGGIAIPDEDLSKFYEIIRIRFGQNEGQ